MTRIGLMRPYGNDGKIPLNPPFSKEEAHPVLLPSAFSIFLSSELLLKPDKLIIFVKPFYSSFSAVI